MNLSLRDIRKRSGMTQDQLAKAIGATKRQVGAWERGENDLPMDYAWMIADLLQCSIDDIAGRETLPICDLMISVSNFGQCIPDHPCANRALTIYVRAVSQIVPGLNAPETHRPQKHEKTPEPKPGGVS